jgi:glycosyltransferase involved in cell wall biosynthesis
MTLPGELNILHVLRAPAGGLFRHVLDLARGQAVRGHRVGLVVADAATGGEQAQRKLADLAPHLAFGVSRVRMSRHVGPRDIGAVLHVKRRAKEMAADVIHGHGAKGGAYARLAGAAGAIRVYTPHGGSLHYGWRSPVGMVYLGAERALRPCTDLLLFESAYGRDVFFAKVGEPAALTRVVHSGVTAEEFAPVYQDVDATDLVFVGELRALKGIDLLIDAVALLAREGKPMTATIAGDGRDRKALQARVARLGLAGAIRFVGAMPARSAFALGRLLVVCSRAESLPYIVIEGAAAGLPMIAARVGGIPEIYGPYAGALVNPGDPAALAQAIARALASPAAAAAAAQRLQSWVRASFCADIMTRSVLAAYGEALVRARSAVDPLVPAKAGTQVASLDSRLRGNKRSALHS